jgi:hypothetical protein
MDGPSSQNFKDSRRFNCVTLIILSTSDDGDDTGQLNAGHITRQEIAEPPLSKAVDFVIHYT